ncbi:MAG: rhomboid family intramembrane serine protease, partial [Hyphomicrobiales bacterium]
MGIRCMVRPEDGAVSLLVDPENMLRADFELTAYETENHKPSKSAKSKFFKLQKVYWEGILAYWAVLLFFFIATPRKLFSINWLMEGAARAGLILDGEWWRTITAMTLHVDSPHLLSNLVFGTFIFYVLCQVAGSGVTWLAILVLGAVGNFANALIHLPTHTSIGASTAVFAAVGLLTGLRQDWRAWGRNFQLNDWAPLGAGFILLAFLGFGGDGRTDIFAHVLGFASGLIGGWYASRFDLDWLSSAKAQRL